MTAIARAGLFGPGQALSPRYTALSGLFWLSVAAVTVLAVAPVTRRPAIARVPRAVLLAGWLAVAAVVAGSSVAHALGEIRYQHGHLQEATRCLRSDAVPSKACLQLIYPDQGPVIHERLAWLREARLSLFARP